MDCGVSSEMLRVSGLRLLRPLLGVLCLLCLSGCQIVGALSHAMPERNVAAYKGLPGQTIAVMVWADRAVLIDWNTIQLDLAATVQEKLRVSKAEEMKGASFPYPAASVVKYQRNHPGLEATPITEIAPQLGASRVIYIEVEAFSTRGAASTQMYRGMAKASMKVIEVADKKGRIAYEGDGLMAVFPKKSPQDGIVNSNDVVMYRGTIETLANEVVDRLTTHDVD